MRFPVTIQGVVAKVATTVLVLYVGGTILNEIGDTLLNTSSPFYQGLTLIGWTVNASNAVTDTNAGGGLLAVVGIIGIASIVMEFVEFRMG